MKYETVKEVLLELIEGDGASYKYESPNGDICMYSERDGSPSCIVGHVIQRLQPEAFQTIHDYEWLYVDADAEDAYRARSVSVGNIFEEVNVDIPMSSETFRLLQVTQRLQDAGLSWGAAVNDALGRVPNDE